MIFSRSHHPIIISLPHNSISGSLVRPPVTHVSSLSIAVPLFQPGGEEQPAHSVNRLLVESSLVTPSSHRGDEAPWNQPSTLAPLCFAPPLTFTISGVLIAEVFLVLGY